MYFFSMLLVSICCEYVMLFRLFRISIRVALDFLEQLALMAKMGCR